VITRVQASLAEWRRAQEVEWAAAKRSAETAWREALQVIFTQFKFNLLPGTLLGRCFSVG
jgi:hypothetical protein